MSNPHLHRCVSPPAAVPKIKAAVSTAVGKQDAPTMAAAGQEFVLSNLGPEGLSCYWYGALLRYADLYFMPETAAQRAAKQERTKKPAAAAAAAAELRHRNSSNGSSGSRAPVAAADVADGTEKGSKNSNEILT